MAKKKEESVEQEKPEGQAHIDAAEADRLACLKAMEKKNG